MLEGFGVFSPAKLPQPGEKRKRMYVGRVLVKKKGRRREKGGVVAGEVERYTWRGGRETDWREVRSTEVGMETKKRQKRLLQDEGFEQNAPASEGSEGFPWLSPSLCAVCPPSLLPCAFPPSLPNSAGASMGGLAAGPQSPITHGHGQEEPTWHGGRPGMDATSHLPRTTGQLQGVCFVLCVGNALYTGPRRAKNPSLSHSTHGLHPSASAQH